MFKIESFFAKSFAIGASSIIHVFQCTTSALPFLPRRAGRAGRAFLDREKIGNAAKMFRVGLLGWVIVLMYLMVCLPISLYLQMRKILALVVIAVSLSVGTAGIVLAKPSLEHSLRDSTGNLFNLTDFRGKVVYVDFWASWCGPCRKSFPWMNQMHERYKDEGLVVVAINLDSDSADAKPFLDDLKPQFVIGYDSDSSVAKSFDLMGMPSSFVFDKQGKLVRSHVGFFTEQAKDYEAELKTLLEQP